MSSVGSDGPEPAIDRPVDEVALVVNGREVRVDDVAARSLAEVLRDDLGLTGVKLGCHVGDCGACSVVVDGDLVSSCLLPCWTLRGRSVVTIEGLADPVTARLQEALVSHGGLQCGFCTPGQVVAARCLLAEEARPEPGRIVTWMEGNLCRCTGYQGIIDAIADVAGQVDGRASLSADAEVAP